MISLSIKPGFCYFISVMYVYNYLYSQAYVQRRNKLLDLSLPTSAVQYDMIGRQTEVMGSVAMVTNLSNFRNSDSPQVL